MKCFVEGGCGKRIDHDPEVQPYNCCLVSLERARMKKRGLMPATDVEWEVFIELDVPQERGPISFRGAWRSKHRNELIDGIYVPSWCVRVARSGAAFLERRQAMLRCLADPDALDVLHVLFKVIDENAKTIQPQPERDAEAVRSILT